MCQDVKYSVSRYLDNFVNRRVFKYLSIFETLIIMVSFETCTIHSASHEFISRAAATPTYSAAKPFLILVSHVVVYNIERTEG